MSVYTAITKAIEDSPDLDAETLCRKLSAKLSKADLCELLLDEIRHRLRQRTRGIEGGLGERFAELVRAHDTPLRNTPMDIDRFRAILDERINVGKGEYSTWGTATIEQHKARIAMLAKQRDGLDETIGRHEEAIRILEACGAPRLVDLVDQAA